MKSIILFAAIFAFVAAVPLTTPDSTEEKDLPAVAQEYSTQKLTTEKYATGEYTTEEATTVEQVEETEELEEYEEAVLAEFSKDETNGGVQDVVAETSTHLEEEELTTELVQEASTSDADNVVTEPTTLKPSKTWRNKIIESIHNFYAKIIRKLKYFWFGNDSL